MRLKKALLTLLLVILIFANMGINYSANANAIFVPNQEIVVTLTNQSNNSVIRIQNGSAIIDFTFTIEIKNITFYWSGGEIEYLSKVKSLTLRNCLDENKWSSKTDSNSSLSRTYTYTTPRLSEGNHSIEIIVEAQLYIPSIHDDYRSYAFDGSSGKILFAIEQERPEPSATTFPLTMGSPSTVLVLEGVVVIAAATLLLVYFRRHKS